MIEGAKGITEREFGTAAGQAVRAFTLSGPSGISFEVSTYGATLLNLWLPGPDDTRANVVLGYDTLQEYIDDPFFIGTTVGRVANRIKGGRFELGGKTFDVEVNNGPDHLHGGSDGWYQRVWDAKVAEVDGLPALILSRTSPDGESGYPGRVEARVSYQMLPDGLRILMEATSDRETVVNMVHHSYFNLKGAGDILGHDLQLHCSEYTPGAPVVPDGRVLPVADTEMDFRVTRRVRNRWPKWEDAPAGFDHSLLVDGAAGVLRPVATLSEGNSGRTMHLFANQPSLQLYTGNFLDGRAGRGGSRLSRYSGICLESQAVPNAICLDKYRDQVLLPEGSKYRHEMLIRFEGNNPRSI